MKTVIEMAREAGGMFDHMMWLNRDLLPVFERLVAAVRADERADEREACAKVCDAFQARDVGMQPAECAGAIRARSNT